MNDIHIRVKLETGDYRRVLLRSTLKRLAPALILILVILSCFFFYAVMAKPIDPNLDRRPVLYGLLVVVPVLIAGALFLGINRQSKKLANSIEGDTEITFSDEGLESSNAMASSKVNWNFYKKVVETANDFVFYPQDNVFFPIPKRCFQGEEQIQEFRALLARHLEKRAKLKT